MFRPERIPRVGQPTFGMTGRSLSSSDEPGPPCVSGGGHSRRPRPTCHSRGSGNPQDRPIRPCSGRSGSLGRASPRLLVLNTPPGFPPSNVSGGGHSRRPRPTCHSRGSGNPQDRPIRPCSGRSGSLRAGQPTASGSQHPAWIPALECLRRGHSRRPRPTCSFPRKRESTGPPNPAMFRPERIPRAGQPTASGSQHPAWIPALECLRRGAFPQATPHLSFPRKRESTGPPNPAMFRAGADPSGGPAHGFWFSTPRLDSRPRMSQSGAGMTESPPLHGFSRGRANPKVIHQGWCPWNPTDFIPDSSPFQAPFWISACAGMTKWGRGTW